MKDVNSKKALIESALMATIVSFFVVGTLYMPILTIFLTVLPVPFIILSIRHGTKYTLLSLIIVSLLIGFLTGAFYTIFVFIVFVPIAVVMGDAVRRRKEPYQVIGLGTAASVLSIFMVLQILGMISGISVIDEIARIVSGVLDHQMEMLTSMNLSVADADEILNYFLMILPGLVVIQSMAAAFVNYYLTAAIINRFHFMDYQLGEFSDFKLPENIILGSFIIFVLSMITRYIEGIQHISLIANVTIIFVVIFFLQGITFTSYLLKKAKVPKAIRIFLIVLLVLISPLMTLVALIGLMEALLNLRRLRSKQ